MTDHEWASREQMRQEVARLIARYRALRGLTMRELATQAEVRSHNQVQLWEQAQRDISLLMWMRVAKVLRIPRAEWPSAMAHLAP